ncbi:hypothetical protein OsI_15460 [Oryza sativa Indica Group]|uniref:Uncharacterized protein n=1 Tax=Oryza sativa subsp. indica TaxID=39946 RepID=B8ASI6_ORYSI|nr:hypothetical protein OsI_15460 [Oryza sativa Indica Group]
MAARGDGDELWQGGSGSVTSTHDSNPPVLRSSQTRADGWLERLVWGVRLGEKAAADGRGRGSMAGAKVRVACTVGEVGRERPRRHGDVTGNDGRAARATSRRPTRLVMVGGHHGWWLATT